MKGSRKLIVVLSGMVALLLPVIEFALISDVKVSAYGAALIAIYGIYAAAIGTICKLFFDKNIEEHKTQVGK